MRVMGMALIVLLSLCSSNVVQSWMIVGGLTEHCVGGRGHLQEVLRKRSARVVYCLMAGAVPVVLRGSLEDVEVHHFPRAHLQNAGRISASVTVIWG